MAPSSPWGPIHGERAALHGPAVTGPALSLVLAMTGRSAVLADLSGEGVATLGARM